MRSHNLGVHTCSPVSSAVKYLRVTHDFMGTTFTMHVYLQCELASTHMLGTPKQASLC